MILKASARGGGRQLAQHLLNVHDNEHVEVHELRGFMAEDLRGALHEAYAVSRGTKCTKYLFSLSLNPPQNEYVPIEAFEEAIASVEAKLGLKGQPRAMVFHEKEGRRHAHCIWSRIDSEEMKAIDMPYFKLKLRDVSKELYIEHDWQMPRGFIDSQARDPANFSHEEWQQAKRTGQNARELKTMFVNTWQASDSKQAFSAALQERGFELAQGYRRGYVAVDVHGEVYAIARWTGKRTKDVRARLGEPESLPSVDEAKAKIGERMASSMQRHLEEARAEALKAQEAILREKRAVVARQRAERSALSEQQEKRWIEEAKERSSRLRKGLPGLWDRITGRHQRTRKVNEAEALACSNRDRGEKERQIAAQLQERRNLHQKITAVQSEHVRNAEGLRRDFEKFSGWTRAGPAPEQQHAAPHEQVRRPRQRPSRDRGRDREI